MFAIVHAAGKFPVRRTGLQEHLQRGRRHFNWSLKLLTTSLLLLGCEPDEQRSQELISISVCAAHAWLEEQGYSKLISNVGEDDIPENSFGKVRLSMGDVIARDIFTERFDSFSGARLLAIADRGRFYTLYFSRYGTTPCIDIMKSNLRISRGLMKQCDVLPEAQKINHPTKFECRSR